MPPTAPLLTTDVALPLVLRLGLIASGVGAVVSCAMGFMVLWQAPRNRLNQQLAVLMGAVFCWSFFAAWLRLVPWVGGMDVVRVGLVWSIFFSAGASWTLVSRARYVPWMLGVMSLVLLVVSATRSGYEYYGMSESGRVEFKLTGIGQATQAMLFFCVVLGTIATFRRRRELRGLFVPMAVFSAAFLSLGVPALTSIGVPIFLAAIASLLLTRAALKQQLFDPLRVANARFRAVLDASPDQLLLVNESGVLVEVDGRKFALGDGPSVPMIGDRLGQWFPGMTVSDLDVAGPRFERTQRVQGTTRHLEIRVSRADAGRLLAIRDITTEKLADRMKDEFVANVSHELRTPLTSIRGALGMFEFAQDDRERAEMLAIASRNTERLLALVNDLLDMQRIESGGLPVQRVPVALEQVARHVIDTVKPLADKRGLELRLLGAGRVFADEARVQQVLANLLSNAIKYSPERGQVEVRVEERGARIRCTVSDRGPGIPTEFRDRLFQRFAQVEGGDTKRSGGTGLGLAISRALVERMGGELGFEPNEPAGSRFFFELPPA